MLRPRHDKAQSTAEYVIVLGLIVAAVVAMQSYIKRGFQGRIKDAADSVDQGGQTENVVQFQKGGQYEPYYLNSSFESIQNAQTEVVMSKDGTVDRDTEQDYRTRNGEQIVGTVEN